MKSVGESHDPDRRVSPDVIGAAADFGELAAERTWWKSQPTIARDKQAVDQSEKRGRQEQLLADNVLGRGLGPR